MWNAWHWRKWSFCIRAWPHCTLKLTQLIHAAGVKMHDASIFKTIIVCVTHYYVQGQQYHVSTKSYQFSVSATTTGKASLSITLTHSRYENLNLFFVRINHKPPWPLAFTGRDRCWVRQGLTVHVVIVHHLDWTDRTALKHSMVRGGRQNMWATRQELLVWKHRLLLGHGYWRRIWQVASDTRERDTGPWSLSGNLACSCQLSRGTLHGLTQRRRSGFWFWHCELVIR